MKILVFIVITCFYSQSNFQKASNFIDGFTEFRKEGLEKRADFVKSLAKGTKLENTVNLCVDGVCSVFNGIIEFQGENIKTCSKVACEIIDTSVKAVKICKDGICESFDNLKNNQHSLSKNHCSKYYNKYKHEAISEDILCDNAFKCPTETINIVGINDISRIFTSACSTYKSKPDSIYNIAKDFRSNSSSKYYKKANELIYAINGAFLYEVKNESDSVIKFLTHGYNEEKVLSPLFKAYFEKRYNKEKLTNSTKTIMEKYAFNEEIINNPNLPNKNLIDYISILDSDNNGETILKKELYCEVAEELDISVLEDFGVFNVVCPNIVNLANKEKNEQELLKRARADLNNNINELNDFLNIDELILSQGLKNKLNRFQNELDVAKNIDDVSSLDSLNTEYKNLKNEVKREVSSNINSLNNSNYLQSVVRSDKSLDTNYKELINKQSDINSLDLSNLNLLNKEINNFQNAYKSRVDNYSGKNRRSSIKNYRKSFRTNKVKLYNDGVLDSNQRDKRKELRKQKKHNIQEEKIRILEVSIENLRRAILKQEEIINTTLSNSEKRKARRQILRIQSKIKSKNYRLNQLKNRNKEFEKKNSWLD